MLCHCSPAAAVELTISIQRSGSRQAVTFLSGFLGVGAEHCLSNAGQSIS
jgi:hypothetical protein